MTTPRPGRFAPGDIVYARWHGGELFEVMEQVLSEGTAPQYKCKKLNSDDYWTFSQLEISRKDVRRKLKNGNRKQLTLF